MSGRRRSARTGVSSVGRKSQNRPWWTRTSCAPRSTAASETARWALTAVRTRRISVAPGTWSPFGPRSRKRSGSRRASRSAMRSAIGGIHVFPERWPGTGSLRRAAPASSAGGRRPGPDMASETRTTVTRVAEAAGAASDDALVAAVRAGDERAFEVLYERHHARVRAFLLGMVGDHGKAEDLTQEVFVAALRRLRATDAPIAFRPWLHEIARNAGIDAYRRARARAQEVPLVGDETLSAGDRARLGYAAATPDVAVAVKAELDALSQAFDGLSDTHHEILVLRELEGRSYAEIGDRLGMTRPAVESTLFRARRRLSQEYGEVASGERCRSVQALIEQVAAAGGGRSRDLKAISAH